MSRARGLIYSVGKSEFNLGFPSAPLHAIGPVCFRGWKRVKRNNDFISEEIRCSEFSQASIFGYIEKITISRRRSLSKNGHTNKSVANIFFSPNFYAIDLRCDSELRKRQARRSIVKYLR